MSFKGRSSPESLLGLTLDAPGPSRTTLAALPVRGEPLTVPIAAPVPAAAAPVLATTPPVPPPQPPWGEIAREAVKVGTGFEPVPRFPLIKATPYVLTWALPQPIGVVSPQRYYIPEQYNLSINFATAGGFFGLNPASESDLFGPVYGTNARRDRDRKRAYSHLQDDLALTVPQSYADYLALTPLQRERLLLSLQLEQTREQTFSVLGAQLAIEILSTPEPTDYGARQPVNVDDEIRRALEPSPGSPRPLAEPPSGVLTQIAAAARRPPERDVPIGPADP